MRAKLILVAAAGALVGTLALAPPAEAGHLDWAFGVGFHVGGLHFRVGLAPTGWGGAPGPFFLTSSRLHHPGYGCHGACFRRGAGYYHHASCPLLGFHFRTVGYAPGYFAHHYSPYRGFGRGHGFYPRPHRYDGRWYGGSFRHGYRDRFRSPYGHHYRDRHHRFRGDHHRYQGHRGHRLDTDRGRHFGNDRGPRGNRGPRGHAQPRGRAQRTRPHR